MPSSLLPVAPYKGLFLLVLVFVALEYFFSTVSDTKAAFFNSTRQPSYYGPLFKTLLFKNNNVTLFPKKLPLNWQSVPEPSIYFKNSNKNFTTNVNNSSEVATSLETTNTKSSDSKYDVSYVGIITSLTENSTDVPLCGDVMQYLYGRVEVVKDIVPTIEELERRFAWLHPGGHWRPPDCKVEKKVALIVPYRNRGKHLLLFLQHMHPFLKRQQLDYTIFVVEQDGDGSFNRAMLFNIGYTEALKTRNFDCFIFHDIDLLPEDDRNLYKCSDQPRHMSVGIDYMKYKLPYSGIFGGVSAVTKEHFRQLNGFSNAFWGWGGEDDDMSNRIRYHRLYISRYPITVARYTSLSHQKAEPSPKRFEVLNKGKTLFDKEGLVSLKYKLLDIEARLLYTWVLVKIEPGKS